ncbi:zinc-binding dehydrogenase [Paracoccus benzoatiresistens]|uniref:enoyl-[acyl-carrier-protein] reductase n=1 Tax=Paracoccus benzoatiresistens TaxID=2997341 RepID=A0ABT4J0Y7_9RHOB|nr:zinc-binding dehydrogenase [Paracoccus sp. EF6]MCZ0960784.1 zinc-binding dehydrogenase [Paracoccus sp. EF6]
MRSIRYDTFGDPAQVLTSADSPEPAPGPGRILVRTLLAPIHNHDLWTVRGTYGVRPALPAIGGSEAAGIVEAVGEGVDAALVGRRVAVAGIEGAWAERFTAPAAGAIPVPDAMPDEAAAQLIAMPFSAITLVEFLGVKPGDWVIQTAANGAVGRMVAVLAKSRGIRLLNLVRRADAARELTGLGMDNVVSTDQSGWQDHAREIIGPEGARAAVDSVGGEVATALTGLLGSDGLLVTFGSATGGTLPLNTGDIIFKELTVKGFWGAKVAAATSPADKQRLFGELIGLVLDGSLPLPAGGIFGLDQAAEAIAAATTPGRSGKIMFRP